MPKKFGDGCSKGYLQYFDLTNKDRIENFYCKSSNGGGFEMSHVD